MDINIRLGGGGGSNGRQAKLSAKKTSNNAVQSMQQASNHNGKSTNLISSGLGMIAKSGSPVGVAIAAVAVALGSIDKIVNFGANVYKGISGEDMIASNIKAHSKTVTTLGVNIIKGEIKNILYVEPRIRRENDMKDYGRELYFNASEKNKLT